VLTYDHRELRSGVPGMLALAGLLVEGRQLPVGDYVISDRMIVERKAGADLVGSITRGRLFDQITRLREAYPVVLLLVEGQPGRFPSEAWKGALAWVLRQGVAVLSTKDAEESAEWIRRLYQQEERGSTGVRGRGPRKVDDPDQLAVQIVSALPGISTVGATRLLGHFGSLRTLVAADATALRSVAGIGPKRAELLERTFAREFGASPLSGS
jgi:ERCC4-type nuclease